MPRPSDERAIAAARLASQLLSGPPARSVEAVVGHLLAVQAQDGRGFRLSVRSRSSGLLAVRRRPRAEHRPLARRVVAEPRHAPPRDGRRLLVAPPVDDTAAGDRERATPASGRGERSAGRGGVDLVVDAVTSDGPQSREQLRVRLAAARIPTAGQALVHILFAATMRGSVVRGPMIDNEHAYVSVPRWLGAAPPPSTVTRRSRGSRAATWWGTPRRRRGTWRSGPA